MVMQTLCRPFVCLGWDLDLGYFELVCILKMRILAKYPSRLSIINLLPLAISAPIPRPLTTRESADSETETEAIVAKRIDDKSAAAATGSAASGFVFLSQPPAPAGQVAPRRRTS
jgi:hypothetical protein